MALNFNEIIDLWIVGETYERMGVLSNLKIKGNLLIHFNTVIAEKTKNIYIVNMTRYSLQTGRLQKKLLEKLAPFDVKIALKVPMDFSGNIDIFIVKDDMCIDKHVY